MKIYLAGIPGNAAIERERELIKMGLFCKRLLSYFWIKTKDYKRLNLYKEN